MLKKIISTIAVLLITGGVAFAVQLGGAGGNETTATWTDLSTAGQLYTFNSIYNAAGDTNTRSSFNATISGDYVGGAQVVIGNYNNSVAGTGDSYVAHGAGRSYFPNQGNLGLAVKANGSTTGLNASVVGHTANADTNYGGWFTATADKTDATNIGIFVSGRNTGSGGSEVEIGGYFSMYEGATAPPSLQSTAILIDNADRTADILVARDNTAEVFVIEDGGVVRASETVGYFVNEGVDEDMALLTADRAAADGIIAWDETDDLFTLSHGISVTGGISATTIDGITAGNITDKTANEAVTGAWDFGGGGLEMPNGTALPATCSVGQIFQDTDSNDCADTGSGDGAICACKSTNTWGLVVDL